MDEATLVLAVSLLLAFLVRAFWRVILNLLMIGFISLFFAAIFFIVLGVGQLQNSI